MVTCMLRFGMQYKATFPEFRFVLIGDSGQGDAAFGLQALQRYPQQVPSCAPYM